MSTIRPARALVLAAAFACAAALPSLARETAPPLEIEPIGFSRDGRYFAWEEALMGDGAGGPAVAINVLDRTTNRPVAGFPFGVPERESEDASTPGQDKWARLGLKEEDFAEPEGFEKLRTEIRKRAAEKLAALDIVARPRRIAGTPFTQTAPAGNALSFVVHRELLGGIPDQQTHLRLRAQMQAESGKCFNEPSQKLEKTIVLTLESFTPKLGRMPARPERTQRRAVSFVASDECPQFALVSDVFAAPAREGVRQGLVVMMFVASWRSHADTSRFVASFLEVE